DLIRKKRDSGEHTREEIEFLVSGYTRGEIPDYQMAAWLMATWLRGLHRSGLASLTAAMPYSGKVLNHAETPGKTVDKHSAALRDATSTVENIGLICASIMSKKLAEGIDALVLDVKTGTGAFMKKEEDAVLLAEVMVETGKRMGKKVVALITDMNQPLGRMAG